MSARPEGRHGDSRAAILQQQQLLIYPDPDISKAGRCSHRLIKYSIVVAAL